MNTGVQEETINNFYFNLKQQCDEDQKLTLLKFDKAHLFEILSKGYQQECIEATIINNFNGEMKEMLSSLAKDVDHFDHQIRSGVMGPSPFSKLENIKNAILHRKLRDCQLSQTLTHCEHRVVHHINNLQLAYVQLIMICDKLSRILENSIHCFGSQQAFFDQIPRIKFMRAKIIESSFIIEEQPPQVMKTNTHFSVSVRWVLGEQYSEHPFRSKTSCCYILSGKILILFILHKDFKLNYSRTSSQAILCESRSIIRPVFI